MATRYWILKTEPTSYSFQDLLKKKHEVWDGISNALALQYLRTAAKGDLALIYHTGKVRATVGVARVTRSAYPDPAKTDPRLAVIDIEPVRSLHRMITLDEIKKEPKLKGLELIRLPRLSFVPVSKSHWNILMKKSRAKS